MFTDHLIEIALWDSYKVGPYCLRERLRHIWHELRTGHPYADQIILTPEQARGLAKALEIYAQQAEKAPKCSIETTD